MYEHFSQGKPVIATDMTELAQSTDLLYIGKDTGFQIGMFEDDDFSLRIKAAGYRVVLRIFELNKNRFEEKWNAPWTPHKLRPGVRPPFEDNRPSPGEFSRLAARRRSGRWRV